MIGRVVLAAAALLLPAAAQAQDSAKPIEEVAADLAYGYCPLFLEGQFALTGNAALAGFGFDEKITKYDDARFGPMQIVTAKRADGAINFGGLPGKACSVVVSGSRRIAALAMLRKNMEYMGLGLKLDPAKSRDLGGSKLEWYKAPMGGQVLNVMLLDGVTSSSASTVAQLFLTAE